ncbi:hypothetical protein ACE103_12515 [Bradyrhizobium sp. ma5]|uniref:hypothetical protein n=1 Tax=Bradyrhizobium sp. ma5 TaxID=3344828 RepID=UPI0035D4255E
MFHDIAIAQKTTASIHMGRLWCRLGSSMKGGGGHTGDEQRPRQTDRIRREAGDGPLTDAAVERNARPRDGRVPFCSPPVFRLSRRRTGMQGSLGEKIGDGLFADVYAWAPGQVVKLSKPGIP